MKVRVMVLALVALFAASALATAQQQTGEIFGKVTDQSGGVLPGVTVTLTSPNLLQPLTAVTSATGTYQFPRLDIGTYTVKFELTGFKTVVNEGIQITVGFSAPVNAQMGITTVQETITVTGESPVVDTRNTGTKQTFTQELLQSIPSARDPWVILQQTAGIAMDRENIGGNMSGQQSNYVSRGGNPFNNKWSMDGVDITDMAATGASPVYYDFDSFEEMTVSTGGVDASQQTGGVGINLVTKSGSDRFKGSARLFNTNDRFESQNITDDLRARGATSGNPIQNIQDYGIEAGGPLKKGRAWIWGSYGKQDVKVGVINFYQPTADCAPVKAAPATFPIEQVNKCLSTDLTTLNSYNLKANVQLFKGNRLSYFNNFAAKVRNARDASDLRPIETTYRQKGVGSEFGSKFWTTGPVGTWKVGDQHIFTDRLLAEVQWAHVGNNFVLDFHDDSLINVQPTFEITSGLWGRSFQQNVFLRPVNSVDATMNYFLPSMMGGDHAIKAGGRWKDAYSYSQGTYGGRAIARLRNGAASEAELRRDSQTIYDLLNVSLYVQDTLTHNRLTVSAGLRYDRNHDKTLASAVVSNQIAPQWLPGITFPGADPKIIFNDFSPRLGFTYDITGDGKTVARGSYGRTYGQVGTGGISSQVNPVSAALIRFPWNDLNGDKVIQANELDYSRNVGFGGNYDPANPGLLGTANTIDPNLKNDATDEVIVGIDREVGAGFAVGGSYIWRRYDRFQWSDTNGLQNTDYAAVNFTPAASACPAGATCPQITYYQPLFPLPGVTTLAMATGYTRGFNGVELTARKRLSNRWLMNASFAYNSVVLHFGEFPGGSTVGNGLQEDPTNRAQMEGSQYGYQSGGSGLDNVYVNAKWLFKLSGMYQLPFDVNVSAFYNARQGYPFERVIRTPTRANSAGTIDVLLDSIGTVRLPNYQNLDFHVERPVRAGTSRLIPQMDIFNVTNGNIIQAQRRIQNAGNANAISAVVAPRVLRFGLKVTW